MFIKFSTLFTEDNKVFYVGHSERHYFDDDICNTELKIYETEIISRLNKEAGLLNYCGTFAGVSIETVK